MSYRVEKLLLSERNNPNSDVRANGVRFWGYPSRRSPIRTVGIHTTENSPGPGVALNVAGWQAFRSTAPGSYHFIVDTRDLVRTLEDSFTAFHIAGHNAPSLGLSFATRASRWGLSASVDQAMLDRGAWVAAQWASQYAIPLRWLTKAQADAGQKGFVRHSTMDPTRRSDPGERFPSQEFFRLIQSYMAPNLEDLLKESMMKKRLARIEGGPHGGNTRYEVIPDPENDTRYALKPIPNAPVADAIAGEDWRDEVVTFTDEQAKRLRVLDAGY